MKIRILEEDQEFRLTGSDMSIVSAEAAIKKAFKFLEENYNNETNLVRKRAWGSIISGLKIFIKTNCLENADIILSKKITISEAGLTKKYEQIYKRYNTVEITVKSFPVKRQNPIKSNYRRDYDKKVNDVRFFFSVDGMIDKETKQAFELITPIFDEILDRYTTDKDVRWVYITEGIREVLRRNNLLATHILDNKELFTKQHIRHLMNELRKNDETPKLIDEDEDYIIEKKETEKEKEEDAPKYDYTLREVKRELKLSGGFFDKFFKA